MNQIKRINDDELLSSTISWLRLPLMIAVVFIHMNPEVNMQTIDYQSLKWNDLYCLIGTLGSHVTSHIAVPCFFMFSGFLYFYKLKNWDKGIYLEKSKKRIKTLIIPYILWNIIPVMIFALLSVIKFDGSIWSYLAGIKDTGILKIFWNYHEWGVNRTNLLGWLTPNYGPFNLPLWFLRDLIVVVILSPIIYHLIKFTKHYGIIILGITYYLRPWGIIPGISLTSWFFFSLGAYFSINKKNFITEFNRNKTFWLAITVVSMIMTTYFIDNTKFKYLFYPIFTTTGVVSITIIVSSLLSKGKLKINLWLSKTSFFIYATHCILILGYSKKLLAYLFKTENVFFEIVRYFGAPIITIGCCVLMYYLLNRITPNTLKLLSGDR